MKKGESVVELQLNALHVPSLGQQLVSMDCLNTRGGVGFQLSERGVPSLSRHGRKWVDVTRHVSGLGVIGNGSKSKRGRG